MRPAKRRNSQAFHAMANPIARAQQRARMDKWCAGRIGQISAFKDGDDCAEFLAAVLDELAVCLKACDGWSVPEWVLTDLLGAVDAMQAMATAGGYWDASHADLLRSALSCAVQINCRMPFERVAIGSTWVRTAHNTLAGAVS